MSLRDRIAEFLDRVYSPDNLDTAPEKLREAVALLTDRQQLMEGMPLLDSVRPGDRL